MAGHACGSELLHSVQRRTHVLLLRGIGYRSRRLGLDRQKSIELIIPGAIEAKHVDVELLDSLGTPPQTLGRPLHQRVVLDRDALPDLVHVAQILEHDARKRPKVGEGEARGRQRDSQAQQCAEHHQPDRASQRGPCTEEHLQIVHRPASRRGQRVPAGDPRPMPRSRGWSAGSPARVPRSDRLGLKDRLCPSYTLVTAAQILGEIAPSGDGTQPATTLAAIVRALGGGMTN